MAMGVGKNSLSFMSVCLWRFEIVCHSSSSSGGDVGFRFLDGGFHFLPFHPVD